MLVIVSEYCTGDPAAPVRLAGEMVNVGVPMVHDCGGSNAVNESVVELARPVATFWATTPKFVVPVAPAGDVTVSVAVALVPGATDARFELESVLDQPLGRAAYTNIRTGEQPALSVFVTVSAYSDGVPAVALRVVGDAETVGVPGVHVGAGAETTSEALDDPVRPLVACWPTTEKFVVPDALAGGVILSVADVLAPGATEPSPLPVTVPVQPLGRLAETENAAGAHPALSVFATVTVYCAVDPAVTFCVAGETVTVGAPAVHVGPAATMVSEPVVVPARPDVTFCATTPKFVVPEAPLADVTVNVAVVIAPGASELSPSLVTGPDHPLGRAA